MFNMQPHYKLLKTVIFCSLFSILATAQNAVPGQHWEQYKNVAEAGFSPEGLEKVKQQFTTSQAASLLVVYKGRILLSYGDNTRRFMTHSIRKSFLNALYGIYVQKGQIQLGNTLEALEIDDINPLTSTEKRATIADLLSARSGIYLPAAYSPRGMEKNLPARGSHAPGTYWYYNNWDFNTLSTIFQQQTSKKIFAAFAEEIATPLGMEDFRISDGYYRYEKKKSIHPAYLFRMSARDMARFGLLYLHKGLWGKQRVLATDWVEKSTSPLSTELGAFSNRGGYGYLWWVSNGIKNEKMYYASGSGGHRIMVLPDADLIVVHRVNTYEGKGVSADGITKLVEGILDARMEASQKVPKTFPFAAKSTLPEAYPLSDALSQLYLGSYKHPFLGYFTIKKEGNDLNLHTNIGIFKLIPVDENHFYPEDIETPIELLPAPSEEAKRTVKPVLGANRSLEKAILYY